MTTRWTDEQIAQWARGKYWFQSFPWCPVQRADSAFVWNTLAPHVAWPGKTALDIGCNYGYHCFAAAKAGAVATGFDTDPRSIEMATTIRDHIELQDVRFVTIRPEETFDVVLYLSVQHQFDPDYSRLEESVGALRHQARETVFVELIVPPLEGRRTQRDIEAALQGEMLAIYRHRVRGTRAIYKVNGKGVDA